jgi:pyruvate kinase
MLDSMINNPRPTRAEASDVANAIFDGSDAVMLSGETASGAYPRESVAMMARIVSQAEIGFAEWGHLSIPNLATSDDAASIARAARELAHDLSVAAIAVFTHTGRSALLLSKARPRVPILALTPEEETMRRLALFWGVYPRLVPPSLNLREIVAQADAALLDSGTAAPGQQAVVVAGFPVSAIRAPNLAYLHNIGERV